MKKKVVVYRNADAVYPKKENLFRPSVAFPEYLFKGDISSEKNYSYDMVRECFHMYGYDKEHYGTAEWNPLGDLVKPGNYVVVKPNMVMDFNPTGEGTDCLFTHPSVVAAVIDYIILALRENGHIVIGDAPMQECNYEKLVVESGYNGLLKYYKEKLSSTGISIELKDFRGYTSVVKNGVHYGEENNNTAHGVLVDLGNDSEFGNYDKDRLDRLRINSYNPQILKMHHNETKHEYLINSDILKADVIINMPKPKTHRKAGVTIALKNLVGINVRKEYLPHHCNGDSNDNGGDEYNKPNFLKKIKSGLQDIINFEANYKHYRRAACLISIRKCITAFIRLFPDQSWDGSWYGNETISKTITDLNKILLYCDQYGQMHKTKQRKIFIVADMIISGENEGPIEPTRKNAGLIAIGESSVCFDEAISTLMGMDINKIPTIRQARRPATKYKIVEADDFALLISNNEKWNLKHIEDLDAKNTMHFIPAAGWIGHIEL